MPRTRPVRHPHKSLPAKPSDKAPLRPEIPAREGPSSRPPLERMMQIHEELRRGGHANCSTLARKLEVSTKTIMRDLNFMRDRLNLPIEYQDDSHEYVYTSEVESFPTVQVTEGEVFALMVARQAMEQYKGTSFERPLASAFGKISSGLRESVSFAPSHSGISFRSHGATESDISSFQALHQAVISRTEVRFLYQRPDEPKATPRRVQPLHLSFVQGAWYLIARDPVREALRTYALTRLSGLEVGEARFERPDDFDPDSFFASSFGVISGKGQQRVRLCFDAYAGRLVSERRWHESQVLQPLPDGSVEMRLELGDFTELASWVLSWGTHVRVLEPLSLVERIAKTAASVARLYASEAEVCR